MEFSQKEEEAEDEYEELKQKQSSLKWKIEEQKDFLEKKRKAAEELTKTQSKQTKQILDTIDGLKNENKLSEKKIFSIKESISEHKQRIVELEKEQESISVEIKETQKKIIKCKNEKDKFEKNGCKEVQNISELIQDIESKMKSTEQEYKEITSKLKSRDKEMKEPFVKRKSVDERDANGVHALLDEMIRKREEELTCPVCLETATVPIFSCSESHLICSKCLPDLPKPSKCPICRKKFGRNPKRNRLAETWLEELQDLIKRKDNMLSK